MPCNKLPPATQKKLCKDVVDWIRNNEPTAGVVDPTVRAIANLAGVPVPPLRNFTPREKLSILKEVLDWNKLKPETVDEPTL